MRCILAQKAVFLTQIEMVQQPDVNIVTGMVIAGPYYWPIFPSYVLGRFRAGNSRNPQSV